MMEPLDGESHDMLESQLGAMDLGDGVVRIAPAGQNMLIIINGNLSV